MYKALTVLVIVAIPVVIFLFSERMNQDLPIPFLSTNEERPLVFFADQVPLRVEVADTDEERSLGLSGRSELDTTSGLLFVFDRADYHGIWMKDMRFPIDIIWINEAFRIVHIERNVHPDTYPKIFEPTAPARFVIETNGNYAESFKVTVGDTVTLPGHVIPEDLRD